MVGEDKPNDKDDPRETQQEGAGPEPLGSAIPTAPPKTKELVMRRKTSYVPKEQKGIAAWIDKNTKFLTFAQVSIVLATAVVYLFGYLCWSLNAWDYNLGTVPAVQIQYFTAGFPFVLILAFCIGFVKITHYFRVKVTRWGEILNNDEASPLVKFFGAIMCILYLVAVIYVVVNGIKSGLYFSNPTHRVAAGETLFTSAILYGLAVYFLVGIALGLPPSDGAKRGIVIPLTVYNVYERNLPLLISTVFLYASAFYIAFGYRNIPQEMGGIRPRYAFMDLKRAELSPDSRLAILPLAARKLPSNISKDPIPITRSILLDVYYVGTDFYIVRPHGDGINSPAIQVKGSTVQGVTWCSPRLIERR